jgi:hypothetical protein
MQPPRDGGPYRSSSLVPASSPRELSSDFKKRVLDMGRDRYLTSLSWLVMFFVLLFVPAGILVFLLLLAGAGVKRWLNRRRLRLLERGRVARGYLVHRRDRKFAYEPTVNSLLTFDFEDHEGVRRRVSFQTYEASRLLAAAEPQIVFDPRNPRRAFLLATLPGSPRLLPDGRLEVSPVEDSAKLSES